MKRKLSTALVMLLAFVLLLGTTAITASAAETTYQPIGGSTSFVKNLVVDADANIPNISFTYSIRRGTAIPATDLLLTQTPTSRTSASPTALEEAQLSPRPNLPSRSLHPIPAAVRSEQQHFPTPIPQIQLPVSRLTPIRPIRPRTKSMHRKPFRSPYPTLRSQSRAYTDMRSAR